MQAATTRMSLVFIALVVLVGAVSADFQLFDLVNDERGLLTRSKRQTENDAQEPNVVECVNPCDTTTTIPGDNGGNSEFTTPGDMGGNSELTTPGDIGGNSEFSTPGDIGGNSELTTPGDIGGNSESTRPGDNGDYGEVTTPGDNGGNSECNCILDKYNRRMAFLFMLLGNFDSRSSYTFSVALYNAFDSKNVDELSVSIRIIFGLQPGNLMDALSNFQEQMSQQLVRHVKVTVGLKHVLNGRTSTSNGIAILHSRFPPSRKINQNNAILIVISGMLSVNPSLSGQSDDDFFKLVQGQMPDGDETRFFMNVWRVISSFQLGAPNDIASPDFYVRIQTVTVQVSFARPVALNEDTKDCDDSEDASDASDLEGDDDDSNEGGEQGVERGPPSSEEHKHSKEHRHSGEHKHSKEHDHSREHKHSKEHDHSKEHKHSKEHGHSREHEHSKEHGPSREHEHSKEHSKEKHHREEGELHEKSKNEVHAKAKHLAVKSKLHKSKSHANSKAKTARHAGAKNKAHSKSKSKSHANDKQ